jgi:hypothetical protein
MERIRKSAEMNNSQRKIIPYILAICLTLSKSSQSQDDSTDNERLARMIDLSEVIIRSDLNIARFISQVKNDTTFYKAFRSLHLVGYTAWNDIRIRDKKGRVKASLVSKTQQNRGSGCRTMDILEEKSTGGFRNDDGSFDFYTGQLYAGIFFTQGRICNENNIVKGIEFSPRSESGIEKRKEQLKMLFFNPGKKIPGIPFIGDKIDIFDPERAALYDFVLDYDDRNGESCYKFSIRSRPDLSNSEKNAIVIDSMITWFSTRTMEVMARVYDMSYDAGVYDFDVHMEVEMTRVGPYLVPRTLRYIGNWDVVFKKRERGFFTATLFDFKY